MREGSLPEWAERAPFQARLRGKTGTRRTSGFAMKVNRVCECGILTDIATVFQREVIMASEDISDAIIQHAEASLVPTGPTFIGRNPIARNVLKKIIEPGPAKEPPARTAPPAFHHP